MAIPEDVDRFIIATLKVDDLQNLMDMARKAPDYRNGHAWACVTMNHANRALTGAWVRNRTLSTGEFPCLREDEP